MDLKIWSKTLLNSYMCFEKITQAIDDLVLTYGLDSANLFDTQAYLYSAEQMIELTERKKLIINLKVLCDTVFANMKPQFARILILKYIDNMKSTDIAKTLGISIRSYFRWLNLAIEAFGKKLNSLGYTDVKLREMCNKEVWIKSVYNKYYIAELSVKIQKDEVEEMENILGLAINSFRRDKNIAYTSV